MRHFRSHVVTNLGENHVQMRMETKKRSSPLISEVFRQTMVSYHKMVSPQNGDCRSGPPGPPPSDATGRLCAKPT